MLNRIGTLARTGAFLVALYALSGGPLVAAGPTECADAAVGGQTGQPYSLQSQSLVTETRTFTVSGGGGCGIGASTTGTISEQYYVGYYRNEVTNDLVRVDCRTGGVLATVST